MKNRSFSVTGNIVDVVARRIFKGTIEVVEGRIGSVREEPVDSELYIMPGLIDAHIHVESSMLIPSEFARLAVVHGTVGTVSDPHEIANVLGVPGVTFMIENGRKVPFKFSFGAPSCVPATPFETAGAVLGVKEVEDLLAMPEVRYLSEMMNFPGVLFGDKEVMAKLEMARRVGKPIDGHAPGVKGDDARRYVGAGITTDHECFTREEAIEKILLGMKVLIREGSAAKNFETLCGLIDEYPDMVMLCSDDKHPNDLVKGHINLEVKRALAKGLNLMNVLRCCTLNPIRHYNLPVGLLQAGDPADFILVDNLTEFNIIKTVIDGVVVAEHGKTLIDSVQETPQNNFVIAPLTGRDIEVSYDGGLIRAIEAFDGQLITGVVEEEVISSKGNAVSDPDRDLLKIIVKGRYIEAPAAVGFIRNFGFKHGAIASSVAHDSHNIVAVGVSDHEIVRAINLVVGSRGGVSLVDGDFEMLLPLPFAGIMSGSDGYVVASLYDEMDQRAKLLGSKLGAPYMTLSFMALLVIPALKLSDKGLFDGNRFAFTALKA